MKNYQDIVSEQFGENYKHRTLRTVFDCYSEEWKETTIDEKLRILRTLLDRKEITLEFLTSGYKRYYLKELCNKAHVVKSLEKSLEILLENALEEN